MRKIIFTSTRKMFVKDVLTNKAFICSDKQVLADYLGIPKDSLNEFFRPVDGIKPVFKRFNRYEIYDLEGEYRLSRKADKV